MSNTVQSFLEFVQEGHYSKKKNAESFLKEAKDELRQLLYAYDGKRFEFEKVGMVAKYVTKEVREIDQEQLIIDLSDYILEEHLHHVLEVNPKNLTEDQKEDLTQFYLPATYYVRPTLNKFGKAYTTSQDILFGGQSEIELVTEIRNVSAHFKRLETEYERLKAEWAKDNELIKKKKLKTPVGSLSYLAHKREYNIEQILNEKSLDFFLQHGKVNLERLNEWIEMGVLDGSILKKNRTVTDITLQFMVMTLDAERKMHQGMEWRKKQLRKRAI